MSKSCLLFGALLWMTGALLAQPSGYTYGKKITIKASKVPGSGSLTNFPVLISFASDNNLRTVANGGHVQNGNGYDIRFTLDDCTTLLAQQVEHYDPVTGKLIVWVRIPSLSATTDTEIQLYYGKSGVSSNPSSNTVWSNGFMCVWHFDENPGGSGAQMTEVTSSGFHGTSAGSMTSGDLVPGKISSCLDFDGSDDVISVPDNNTLDMGTSSFTLSAWVNVNTTSGPKEIINKKDGGSGTNGYAIRINPDRVEIAHKAVGQTNVVATSSSPQTLSTGVWYYITGVFNTPSDNVTVYVNGVAEPTIPINAGASVANTTPLRIGKRSTDDEMNGKIDEPRIANVTRTSDWIMTEYNNQNLPDSFYMVSAEMTAAGACQELLLPVELVQFEVYPIGNAQVKLSWKTAIETGSGYFEIQRSRSLDDWETIETLTGAGNTSVPTLYSALDETPYKGTSYYRLRQVDVDGQAAYSEIKPVSLPSGGADPVRIYPNPSKESIVVEGSASELEQLSIQTLFGQDLTGIVSIRQATDDSRSIDLSALPSGIYLVKTKTWVNRICKE